MLDVLDGVDMDTYRNLLAKVNTNVQNQMTLSYESTSEYNIFSLLGVAAKEVIMCRFFGRFVEPRGYAWMWNSVFKIFS